MSRNFILPIILAGAVGIPFLASQDGTDLQNQHGMAWDETGSHPLANSSYANNTLGIPVQLPHGSPANQGNMGPQFINFNGRSQVILPGSASGPDLNAMPLAFVPVTDFGQVLRFDVDAAWIKSRWERVSIFSAESGTTAYRCDLVTGVNPGDLHGCITYYLDSTNRVQKLSFRGWTGEAEPIARFATEKFRLEKQPSSAIGVFVNKSWSKMLGALILQNPPIARHDNPNQNIAVFLEVNNPQVSVPISPQMQAAVAALR
jgi:hypothetical protein